MDTDDQIVDNLFDPILTFPIVGAMTGHIVQITTPRLPWTDEDQEILDLYEEEP